MTSSERTPLPDIPKGYEFPEHRFFVDPLELDAYLASVHDANDCYEHDSSGGYVPPLLLTAFALQTLLQVVGLPAGSLHTGQECEMHSLVRAFDRLVMRSTLAQRSERAGLVISLLDFAVMLEDSGALALTGRTTVMAPTRDENE